MSEMRGLKELLENLKGLDRNMNAEARGAANAGAQVVKRAAVVNARMQKLEDSGALLKNIAVKREKGTARNIYEYHVGVRHGPETKGAQRIAVRSHDGKIHFQWTDNPFYWWFWEFGHYNGFLKRHVPARPFIRPALSSNTSQVLDAMKIRLADRLEKFTQQALK